MDAYLLGVIIQIPVPIVVGAQLAVYPEAVAEVRVVVVYSAVAVERIVPHLIVEGVDLLSVRRVAVGVLSVLLAVLPEDSVADVPVVADVDSGNFVNVY